MADGGAAGLDALTRKVEQLLGERKAEAAEQLARTDLVTGLANRFEFLENLVDALAPFGFRPAPGFVAGMVRKFIKGAVEKAREKIKNLYGVDISDKAVLQQIVDIDQGKVRIGIQAPRHVSIMRGELLPISQLERMRTASV